MKEYEKPIVQVIDFAAEEIMTGEGGEVGEGFGSGNVGGGAGTDPFG